MEHPTDQIKLQWMGFKKFNAEKCKVMHTNKQSDLCMSSITLLSDCDQWEKS